MLRRWQQQTPLEEPYQPYGGMRSLRVSAFVASSRAMNLLELTSDGIEKNLGGE